MDALGEVTAVARHLYSESATPEERTRWFNHHVEQVEIMNGLLDAFDQPPGARSMWGRGVPIARMEVILRVQDLLTLASRGNPKKWIREARREMSRLTRLAFVDEYHVPTLAALHDELLTT